MQKINKIYVLLLVTVIIAAITAVLYVTIPNKCNDESSAIKVAREAWDKIYGKDPEDQEKTVTATLIDKDTWSVLRGYAQPITFQGSIPTEVIYGGGNSAMINRKTCEVLNIRAEK